MRYSRVQKLILGSIEEWNQTICKTSRHKDDLGFIRDMHRLLTYKGYIFPEVKPEDASVLNPSDNLKSIEEIQKEEQIAHAAKLQELVRRGRPQDLKEANKLMKIMAGFKDDTLVESRAKVAEDLDRLRRKADIFSEMLQQCERSGALDSSDETLVELFSSLKVAQPKIQKIITEEQDDDAAVQDLLKLNDSVNALIEKYNLLKVGDIANASHIKVASNGSGVQQSLSLIDFGDDDNDSNATPPPQQGGSANVDNLLDDLNLLSFNNPPQINYGLGGDITLRATSPPPPQQPQGANYDIFAQLSQPQSSQPTTSATSDFDLLADFGPTSSSTQHSTPATQTNRAIVNESQNLRIDVEYTRESTSTVRAKAIFSNMGASQLSNLTFLVAVPKSLQLRLEPQNGSTIPSFAKESITQLFRMDGAQQGTPLKIRWKVNYSVSGNPVEEMATFTFPSV